MPDTEIYEVIKLWEAWCGKTPWSESLKKFADLGGQIEYWCGVPRSHSAIPLTFALFDREGKELHSNSRLKDIKNAIKILEESQCDT